jgi:SAM-dependent methyltransferase
MTNMEEKADLNHLITTILTTRQNVILELGCGPHKRHMDAIGIDRLGYPGVDIVSDIDEALCSFPSSSVQEVHSYHCFEHLHNLAVTMEQLARVIANGGILHVVVPHFSNPYFYSDPTHRKTFGLYTFSYFAKDSLLRRKVPSYMKAHFFDIERLRLGFKSPRPFYVRWLFKRSVGLLFNLSYYLMEFYEENLCYLIPCYEIEFWLRRNETAFTE